MTNNESKAVNANKRFSLKLKIKSEKKDTQRTYVNIQFLPKYKENVRKIIALEILIMRCKI